VVEVVQSFARVTRVGIFSRDFQSGRYCLKAGIKCFEDSWNLIVSPEDPLVQWLQFNAHLVSRESLAHIRDAQERVVLDQSLDMLGAELIVPLLARDRLLGWLFIGHRLTGVPFDEGHLEELMALAEHVSTSLENAQLYSENAVQKTFAETVLQSIPVGIVSVDSAAVIRWFNESAATILEYPGDQLLGQHAAKLGSQLSDMLTGAIAGKGEQELQEWVDPFTKRSIAVSTERLMSGDDCLGAVAVIKDLTRERLLTEKQEQLERAVFWTELASAMSHEVRNPLVAVSTFAQLLPERYSDEEFREQFSTLVEAEVARLNQMVDQIDSFANPPEVQQRPINVEQVLKKASDLAVLRGPKTGLQIVTSAEEGLKVIHGDEQALTECLTHLLVNALESLRASDSPSVRISASSMDKAQGGGVVINIRDNGRGISGEIIEKIYSPFCTTKARGIGLGLPIARRTVTDHNGQLDVESSDHGTSVTMVLPQRRMEIGTPHDEAHISR
jgi:nitrogen fixation/metabolism regulation signal transduction histidine kinase